MIKFTNAFEKSSIICDHCRQDLQHGENVCSLSYGKIEKNYVSRDYDKSEIVMCLNCVKKVSQILALTAFTPPRYADSLIMLEAA